MKALLYVCLLLSSFETDKHPIHSYALTVKIHGIKINKGLLRINLYNSSAGFPSNKTKALRSVSVDAVKPTTEMVFNGLPAGTYAIAVVHDENNNGVIDKNFLGIPTEGYGVSNNAKGFMSAPSFVHAKFELQQDATQQLRLSY